MPGTCPKVSLYASSRQTRSDSESSYNQKYDTNSVGIQVSLPLFAGRLGVGFYPSGGANQLCQAQYELDAQTSTTLVELRKQFNLNTSGAAKARAYEMAVSSATRHWSRRRRKASAEASGLTSDVLDAEQQLFTASRDLANARMRIRWHRIQSKYYAGC